MTVKPSIIQSFNQMYKYLKDIGLNSDDIVTLIQRRTKPRVSRTQIVRTLKAIKEIEQALLRGKEI